MRGSKPGERRGGRKKGTPNKLTVAAKDAIAQAFDRTGGIDRLVTWVEASEDNRKVFYASIYPKLIPVQLTGEGGGPLVHEIRRSLVRP
jgi:hypothetical protein